MLTIVKREPQWLEVLGARWLFDPISWPMVRRARKAARVARGDDAVDDADAEEVVASMSDAVSLALLGEGLRDWDGVGDVDGEPLACTREARAVALADPTIFEALDLAYVQPFVVRLIEGNGSAPSQPGTGGAPTPDKPIAGTAPATASRATRARTRSTRRKPTKASSPGGR